MPILTTLLEKKTNQKSKEQEESNVWDWDNDDIDETLAHIKQQTETITDQSWDESEKIK